MSYAASYCLFNYTLARPSEGYHYGNLRLVRAFEYGLDPKSSEAGFVLTHVDMVKETGALVNGALKVLETIEQNGSRSEVNEGYREILKSMEKIEECMEGNAIFHLYMRRGRLILKKKLAPRHVEELTAW